NSLVKITLSKKKDKSSDLKNIFVKPIEVKAGLRLCFVYRYNTKDITKNYEIDEATDKIISYLENDFSQANVFTTTQEYSLMINKKNRCKIISKKTTSEKDVELTHDKNKRKFVDIENNIYLREL
uniref:Uncharacterized protein n=1 Tax=Setaria digitata TaxID=48799 RepID=A0A915PPF9_9BILA